MADKLTRQAVLADVKLHEHDKFLLHAPPNGLQAKFDRMFREAERVHQLSMEDFVTPDGRRMTRMVTPYGTYCAEIRQGDDGVRHAIVSSCMN